jgi:hypothetical protein
MLALVLLVGLFSSLASPSQALESTWKTCVRETAKVERSEGIPKHLLAAISRVESGRWNKQQQANIAWPWTVMADGEGRYFETKREAIEDVHTLMEMGITNIDVGCMQINLFFHGDEFDNLEQALEPKANVAYAAKYLKNMYKQARNWTKAAGYYHSKTPEKFQRYKVKVIKFWNDIRRGGPETIETAAKHTPPVGFARRRMARRGSLMIVRNKNQIGKNLRHVSLNQTRTRILSDKFRINRENRLAAENEDVRSTQLDNWRKYRGSGVNPGVFAKARRAALDAKRRHDLEDMEKTGSEVYFEKRRKFQLTKWRRGRAMAQK